MTMVIMMAICESHVMMITTVQVGETLMMVMTIKITMIIMMLMIMLQVCAMLREKRVAASNRFSFDLFWFVVLSLTQT